MADEGKPAGQILNDCQPYDPEHENLREKAARLQAILDTTVDGIITINESRIIQSFNKAAESIFGYPAKEVIGKNVNMLMPSPYHEEHEGYVDHYLKTGERKIIGIGREVVGRRKDGSIFPLYLAVSEAWVGGRRLFSGILRDITERKNAEKDLKRAKDELEERVKERTAQLMALNVQLERINRDLQDFLFVASNDLQEPLRKIQTLNDLIKTNSCRGADTNGMDYFEKMQDEARRMQDLVQALLSYSKIATKAGPFMVVDLNRVVRDVLKELDPLVERTGARIEIEEMPKIKADPGQIHQLLFNLFENALKFQGEEVPVIRFRCEIVGKITGGQAAIAHSDEFLRITMEDNGIGFDEKYLDRIFRPFERLHHSSSPYEGIGMGLAICKKIVEVHGGIITARSTPGKGSSFIILLPMYKQRY